MSGRGRVSCVGVLWQCARVAGAGARIADRKIAGVGVRRSPLFCAVLVSTRAWSCAARAGSTHHIHVRRCVCACRRALGARVPWPWPCAVMRHRDHISYLFLYVVSVVSLMCHIAHSDTAARVRKVYKYTTAPHTKTISVRTVNVHTRC
eukprot:scaffold4418_cov149-Isochrysis_galbana.AAC.1